MIKVAEEEKEAWKTEYFMLSIYRIYMCIKISCWVRLQYEEQISQKKI